MVFCTMPRRASGPALVFCLLEDVRPCPCTMPTDPAQRLQGRHPSRSTPVSRMMQHNPESTIANQGSRAKKTLGDLSDALSTSDNALRRQSALLERERRARREAETSLGVISEQLARLSHEFRTPLQAMLGYTELLQRELPGPLNADQHCALQRIRQSQQHLITLMDSVLESTNRK